MDPLTAASVDVLGKYAIDKRITLLKEAGQATAHTAAAPLALQGGGVM